MPEKAPVPKKDEIRENYIAIADAIRGKKGTDNEMTPAEMPNEIATIQSIQSGDNFTLIEGTFSNTFTYSSNTKCARILYNKNVLMFDCRCGLVEASKPEGSSLVYFHLTPQQFQNIMEITGSDEACVFGGNYIFEVPVEIGPSKNTIRPLLCVMTFNSSMEMGETIVVSITCPSDYDWNQDSPTTFISMEKTIIGKTQSADTPSDDTPSDDTPPHPVIW